MKLSDFIGATTWMSILILMYGIVFEKLKSNFITWFMFFFLCVFGFLVWAFTPVNAMQSKRCDILIGNVDFYASQTDKTPSGMIYAGTRIYKYRDFGSITKVFLSPKFFVFMKSNMFYGYCSQFPVPTAGPESQIPPVAPDEQATPLSTHH